MVRFNIVGGPWMGRQIELSPDRPNVIGRGRGCDIRIDHRKVSRRHAEVFRIGQAWCIRDLCSLNGTRVNRKQIKGTRILHPDDQVSIRPFTFAFEVEAGVDFVDELMRFTGT